MKHNIRILFSVLISFGLAFVAYQLAWVYWTWNNGALFGNPMSNLQFLPIAYSAAAVALSVSLGVAWVFRPKEQEEEPDYCGLTTKECEKLNEQWQLIDKWGKPEQKRAFRNRNPEFFISQYFRSHNMEAEVQEPTISSDNRLLQFPSEEAPNPPPIPHTPKFEQPVRKEIDYDYFKSMKNPGGLPQPPRIGEKTVKAEEPRNNGSGKADDELTDAMKYRLAKDLIDGRLHVMPSKKTLEKLGIEVSDFQLTMENPQMLETAIVPKEAEQKPKLRRMPP